MKRLLALLVGVGALALPAAAAAHPLGNFTVNRSAVVEVAGSEVYVRYALDLAEIPTFQDGAEVRAAGFAETIARDLELRIDGQPVVLRVLDEARETSPGQGGLETLRYDALYQAEGSWPEGAPVSLAFRDGTFAGRLGWKEVVVNATGDADIVSSTVPETSPSDALRDYPENLLQSPPDVSSARAVVEPGTTEGAPPSIAGTAPREAPAGGFEALVTREDLGLGVMLVSLLVAMFWGAAHALTPGHGKAIVAAYMVGTRGTARHAFLLGGIVTVTHTIGVFALGVVTLTLSEFVVPETLYPWLNLVSAVLVVLVGLAVLRFRLFPQRSSHGHDHHHGAGDHDHGHGHHHHHGPEGHGHDHVPPPGSGLKGLVAVGVSGGLLPCPTALVVLLAAISLHRVAYGLVLIVAFSVGLAATITAIGLLAVTAKRLFARLSFEGRLVRLLPAASAVVIIGLGIAMTIRALPTLA